MNTSVKATPLLVRATAESPATRALPGQTPTTELLVSLHELSTEKTDGGELLLLLEDRVLSLCLFEGRELDEEGESCFGVPADMTMDQLRAARIGLVLRSKGTHPKLHAGPLRLHVRVSNEARFRPYRRWPFGGWLGTDDGNGFLLVSLQGSAAAKPAIEPTAAEFARLSHIVFAFNGHGMGGPFMDPLRLLESLGDSVPSTYPEGGGSIRG